METMHGLKVEEGAMRGPLNVSRKQMKSTVGAPLVIMEFWWVLQFPKRRNGQS